MSDDVRIRRLADQQAIIALIYTYCRAVDRMDAALGRSVWHGDGTADYGDVYRGSGHGLIDAVNVMHRGTLAHSHQVTNILIELDGQQAASEAYVTATLRLMRNDAPAQITVWSRYADRWSCRDGRWGLDARRAIIDFDEVRPVTPIRADSSGCRDAGDPSYAVFGAVGRQG